MNSDNERRRPDAKWRPVGAGISATFLCARCAKHRLVAGRRLQRVAGLKTWVCKDCK